MNYSIPPWPHAPGPDPREIKHQFLIRNDVIFLNHGSFGACPRVVFETYQSWQRELEEQPVEFLGRRFLGLMSEARAKLAEFVGSDPDGLIFVPNATYGMNVVARSLAHTLPLGFGDEILTTDHEYGAIDRVWRFIAQHVGARLRRVTLPSTLSTPEELAETILAEWNPRTRIFSLSWVTSPTALVMPIKMLVEEARRRGVVTVIDAAHAPGLLDESEFRLEALGADFVVGNCHKWMLAPKGAGFLYAAPRGRETLEPFVVSWGYQADPPGRSRFLDQHGYTGTTDPAAYLSVPTAIEFLRNPDWVLIRERCRTRAAMVRRRVAEIVGSEPERFCPDSSQWFRQMVACPLPSCDALGLQKALWERHRVEVPCTRLGGSIDAVHADDPRRWLRVSVQGYTTDHDLETLLGALREEWPRYART
ncbi:aminotransferase class V [Isosphaera pallida ATCC 43644]|uniref:Aminotransferase class V n=1 Tax=Isosphaera pallida (strain ATCC 43644 / DSM 9630 / IS1B) TaxID=575540 RepID=E8R1L3_ISOPI|nr:aminotransferase class V-fold PLP-dependent enzyme [Isosphaera pallida]ADV63431.1 aminotransferase class V [Isosphaera pallida ATCC 43644]